MNSGIETVKKKSTLKIVVLTIVGVFVGLTVLGAIVGDPEPEAANAAVTATTVEQGSVQADESGEGQANNLTAPQNNAARSAKQYLDMTGFSRDGLIDQLSSDAGNGYEVADATAAVDSLNVDWNKQAVRSAKQYLDMTGFSCKGLIDQLSSSSGSQYTKSEATYGAQQAGAC